MIHLTRVLYRRITKYQHKITFRTVLHLSSMESGNLAGVEDRREGVFESLVTKALLYPFLILKSFNPMSGFDQIHCAKNGKVYKHGQCISKQN
jgi:hypothetical protein